MKRRTATGSRQSRRGMVFLGVWLDARLAAALDERARLDDTDKSKLIRAAIRRAIENAGVSFEQ